MAKFRFKRVASLSCPVDPQPGSGQLAPTNTEANKTEQDVEQAQLCEAGGEGYEQASEAQYLRHWWALYGAAILLDGRPWLHGNRARPWTPLPRPCTPLPWPWMWSTSPCYTHTSCCPHTQVLASMYLFAKQEHLL